MHSTPEHSPGAGGDANATDPAVARSATLQHNNSSSVRATAPCTRYAIDRRVNGSGQTPPSRKSSSAKTSRKKSSSPPSKLEHETLANSNALLPSLQQAPPPKPSEIDSSDLIEPPSKNVSCLSSDGYVLKPGLKINENYLPVPESLWRALERWYGAKQALPRYVRSRIMHS